MCLILLPPYMLALSVTSLIQTDGNKMAALMACVCVFLCFFLILFNDVNFY